MLLKQMFQVIRLLGLRRAAKMKKRHEEALPLLRGYAATSCFWTLLNVGFWDELAALPAGGTLDLAEYAKRNAFDLHVLESVCSYLDGIRLAEQTSGGSVRLTKRSRDLLAEPRGLFELLYAYEPVFVDLEAMLRGTKRYGPDVRRRTRWVGLGSGRLCRQLPYPVMLDMAARHGRKRVLDLGCGDGAFLMELAKAQPQLTGLGIDIDAPTVQLANEQITAAGLAGRLEATCFDMFDLAKGDWPRGLSPFPHPLAEKGAVPFPEAEPGRKGSPGADQKKGDSPLFQTTEKGDSPQAIDCLTACDTFHEYLWTGDEPVVNLLRGLKATFPAALFVVGEFCKQSHESLRKRPTAFLEHHLFHQLTNQRIESADRWREIFGRAGLTIREEKVFDLVGHGYFVLE